MLYNSCCSQNPTTSLHVGILKLENTGGLILTNEWFMGWSSEEGHCLPHLMSWWSRREKCSLISEECCHWQAQRQVCALCKRVYIGFFELDDVELAAESHQVERNVALIKVNFRQCELVCQDGWKPRCARQRHYWDKIISERLIYSNSKYHLHIFDMRRIYKSFNVAQLWQSN